MVDQANDTGELFCHRIPNKSLSITGLIFRSPLEMATLIITWAKTFWRWFLGAAKMGRAGPATRRDCTCDMWARGNVDSNGTRRCKFQSPVLQDSKIHLRVYLGWSFPTFHDACSLVSLVREIHPQWPDISAWWKVKSLIYQIDVLWSYPRHIRTFPASQVRQYRTMTPKKVFMMSSHWCPWGLGIAMRCLSDRKSFEACCYHWHLELPWFSLMFFYIFFWHPVFLLERNLRVTCSSLSVFVALFQWVDCEEGCLGRIARHKVSVRVLWLRLC